MDRLKMFSLMLKIFWHHASLRWTGLILLCLLALAWDVAHRTPVNPAAAAWPKAAPGVLDSVLVPISQGTIPMPQNTPAAHASSLLAMPKTHPAALLAFWFAGSKESAPDIQIAAAAFDRSSQRWQNPQMVVNRTDLGAALGFAVRRLGNPVAWLDAEQRVHLFVVATGLGGWAASRIVHLRQRSAYATLSFELAGMLPLSWLWNTSFLVRTAPLPLQDGGMVLPVYFELGLKYPVALRFDAKGNFLSLVRMSRRTHLLQPTLVMQSEQTWLAFMRDQRPDGKVTVTKTLDAGQHWHDLPDLDLLNPDASIAGLGLAPGQMLLAHNSSVHSRNVLDLSQSTDGIQWTLRQTLARGSGADEFSYPAMAWADDDLWISYTEQRQRIAWQRMGLAKP